MISCVRPLSWFATGLPNNTHDETRSLSRKPYGSKHLWRAIIEDHAAHFARALARRGVRVGDEINVISGNNDQALIAGLHPPLVTFDIHAHDIGRLAVQQMQTRLRMKEPLPDVDVILEPHLVPGESVRTLTN